MKRNRLAPTQRKLEIVNAAVHISMSKGFIYLTRAAIAKYLKITETLTNHYFPDFQILRKKVIEIAIEEEILCILATAWIQDEPLLHGLSKTLKNKIKKHLFPS